MLTGRINRPPITLHGTLNTRLTISLDSATYATMFRAAGRDRLHRYHRVDGGTHVDGLVDVCPDRLSPIAPRFRAAFDELTTWVS